jgi:hypothetical protein
VNKYFAEFVGVLLLVALYVPVACSGASDPARDAKLAHDALVTACAFVPATAGRSAQNACAAVRGACDGAGGSP